jgi:hypothetical protein
MGLLHSRTAVIILLLAYWLSGCYPEIHPSAWQDKTVSMAHFSAFDIQPVTNSTGKPISQDILTFLTITLKEKFADNNLHLADSSGSDGDVLLVQAEILVYEVKNLEDPSPLNYPFFQPRSIFERFRTAECVLHTRLINKSTGTVVGEITASSKIDVEADAFRPNSVEFLLQELAAAVAKEVTTMK